MLDEEEVRDDVQAERLQEVVEREVGGLAFGVENPAREERCVDVRWSARVQEVGESVAESVCRGRDTFLGG